MAGLGRRTHYRKHLTDSVLYDLPEPKEYERIAKVVATRGGNQFDIILADTTTTTTTTTTATNSDVSSRSGLAILPTKFHKLVWVKRNDYVIVRTGIDSKQDDDDDDDDDEKQGDNDDVKEEESQEDVALKASITNDASANETGIRFIITHILYKDQVKHLVSKGFWPENDPEFPQGGNVHIPNTDDKKTGDDGIIYNAEYDDCDDGIVYTEYDMDNDDDLFVNTNRIARLEIQDSDSEEDSSDEE
uniref:S1-like domain-containing protein n=1 Tax=Pseudo-nitzschia australis TaxID=44445 RepID=A0A7S4AEQ1_9STRA